MNAFEGVLLHGHNLFGEIASDLIGEILDYRLVNVQACFEKRLVNLGYLLDLNNTKKRSNYERDIEI